MTAPLWLLVPQLPVGRSLHQALLERGAPVAVVPAADVRVDLAARRVDAGAVVNLVDEAAPPTLRAFVTEYLAYLADLGTPVVNGLDAFVVGCSRARQLALLAHLGVRHPPARVVADAQGVAGALADLGLAEEDAAVDPGPPVVVQQRLDVGEVVRIGFVGGRFVAATVADGEVVSVEDGLVALAEQAIRTAQIEVGGLSFGIDPVTRGPTCVGVDTRLGDSPGELEAAVEYVLYRAGAG